MNKKKVTNIDLLALRDFIQKRAGLFLAPSKFSSITQIIEDLYNQTSHTTFHQYLGFLQSDRGEKQLLGIISNLTTNETFFFRVKAHFDVLKRQVFPQIIQQRSTTTKTINIWCAACSTGEEAYSIAISLLDLLPDISSWKIKIYATDIDEQALIKAQQGVYRSWSFRGVDQQIIDRYFIPLGSEYEIKEKYKSIILFQQHNLVSESPLSFLAPGCRFDLISCRNVTIYFKQETTRKLAQRFFTHLEDGGYLLVGHSEHSAEIYDQFITRSFPEAIIYQKKPLHWEKENPLQLKIKQDYSLPKTYHTTYATLSRRLSTQNITQNSSKEQSKQVDQERRIQSNAIDHQPEKKSEETGFFASAVEGYRNKNYFKSIDYFRKVLDINPRNIRACWMLSHIAANQGYLKEAIAWSEKCIEIDAIFKEAYYTLGLIYMAQGENIKAEKNLKKTIYIDSEFKLGYFALGNLYKLMKQENNARKYYQLALEGFSSDNLENLVEQSEELMMKKLLNLSEIQIRQ